ncbi:hypothetical protein QD460_02910 [Rhizobium jaguaris]|uniref:hypothetical protein n=1 Tax=Rhizobium jaguaris TaxID=1312183 RepID=UPI0039BF5EA3
MELVVSCDGVPASSEPELATQADKMREARKIADTADRRIGTRTQKQQSTTESMPSENHRHEMLTDNYQKRLNPIFTVQRPTSLREEKAPLIVVGLARRVRTGGRRFVRGREASARERNETRS